MSKPFIKRLKISNFKSIDTLELHDVGPFSVFAGANGTGKSNFFDALSFFQRVLVSGAVEAIRESGGMANVRSYRQNGHDSDLVFKLEIDCSLPSSFKGFGLGTDPVPTSYSLSVVETERGPELEERLFENGREIFQRTRADAGFKIKIDGGGEFSPPMRSDYSALSMFMGISIVEFARNIRIYRIDPKCALSPMHGGAESTRLAEDGGNLVTVLARMEENAGLKEAITDWINLIVPSIESVEVKHRALDRRSLLEFKDKFVDRSFPAEMVSQGTMYALSLLVAILDGDSGAGLTLIEEPERGLHPKAIGELIELMRDTATPEQAFWISTHSETVVKHTNLDELWLVDRHEGQTVMKHASAGNLTDEDIRPLGMDEAWLSNLLGAGLPW